MVISDWVLIILLGIAGNIFWWTYINPLLIMIFDDIRRAKDKKTKAKRKRDYDELMRQIADGAGVSKVEVCAVINDLKPLGEKIKGSWEKIFEEESDD